VRRCRSPPEHDRVLRHSCGRALKDSRIAGEGSRDRGGRDALPWGHFRRPFLSGREMLHDRPSESAGKNVSAPTMRTPRRADDERPPFVGKVPGPAESPSCHHRSGDGDGRDHHQERPTSMSAPRPVVEERVRVSPRTPSRCSPAAGECVEDLREAMRPALLREEVLGHEPAPSAK